MNTLIENNGPTMSSREIADLVDSRHDKVKQSIDRLVSRGVIGAPPVGEYLDSIGRPAREYRICKRDSYVIVAQLSPEFTARLVDRWQELEARASVLDLNNAQALRTALLSYTEQVLALEATIEEQAPAVEFARGIRNTADAVSIGDFARVMGYGQNRFFAMLRRDHYLTAENRPYQHYLDRGYFRVIESSWTDGAGNVHPTFKTLITGAGQVYLHGKYAKEGCAA